MAKAKQSKLVEVGEEARDAAQRALLVDAIRSNADDMEAIAKAVGVTRSNLYEVASRLGVDLAAERKRAARAK